MQRRTFYFYLFVCLCFISLTTRSIAQTITTGPITPSSICSSGGKITINYTITGTFSATNTFSAQISDATGTFSASPTVIGSVSGASAVPINVTIPAIANGAYKIRVVSTSPIRTGSTSDLTVASVPSAPGTSAVSYCVGQSASALTAISVNGATLNWYGTSQTGGTASSVSPTPSTSAVGNTTYYVSQSIGGCESSRASLVVTVGGLPTAPAATSPAPYCQGAPATKLTATGSNLKWYGASGNLLSEAPTPSTSAAGTTTYYVTQSAGSCESPRTTVTVTVKAGPGVPGISAIEFCQGSPAPALTASFTTGATPNWYGTNQTGGTASTTPPTPSNTTSATYYVSQTLDGCEGPRVGLSVRVKALPATPGVANLSLCHNGPAAPLTANGVGLKWYDAADKLLDNIPTPSTSTPGNQTFKVSQTVEGCEGPKATLTVQIKSLANAPVGNTPAPYCQGNNASALTATGQNLLWYGPNATGGVGSPSATIPSTANPGSITYYVSQTVDGCETARSGIVVTVKPKPVQPGTSSIDFCQGSPAPTLAATFVAGATPNWYGLNATGGTASTTPPVPSNTTPGTVVYYVSQTVDGCEGDRARLNVRVKALPTIPGVANIGFCNNAPSSQLAANGQNLKWYDAADKLLDVAPTPATSATGTQTFKVSQTVESCEGPKATLIVTIKPLPAAPGIANLNYCLQTQDQPVQNVTALTAYGENLRWFNSDGNQYPNAPVPAITQIGTQTYLVDQTYNGCTGPKATLQVTIRTTAAPTVAKPLVTYCINERAVPLVATAETGASLRWIDPYDRVLTEAPTPSTLNTSIKPDGDPFYVFQIGQNGCYSERAITKVIVNALPTLSLISPVTSINLGRRVALQLKFTSIPPFSYTLADGQSGVANRTDTTLSLLPRSTTTYQVAAVRNSCGAGLPGSPATATITVRVPTVTTSALTTSTLCAGTSISVPFTTTGEFNQGNQFRIELVSVADTSKKYAAITSSTTSPVTSSLPLTLVGGQYYVRVKADNPEIAVVGSNSPTQLTIHPKPSATLTGTKNIYEGYPTSLTIALGGESPWTVTYADSVQSYSATATTTPYTPEVRPTRTTTYKLVSVANACGTGTVSGTATVTVLPLLAVEDDPLGPLVKTYPIPTTSVITVELNLPLTRNPAILSVTDMSGKSVIQQTSKSQKQELDLTAQPNGLYLLRIQVGDKQTVRKVLKQ